jgi:hypothetical protein
MLASNTITVEWGNAQRILNFIRLHTLLIITQLARNLAICGIQFLVLWSSYDTRRAVSVV